MTEEEVFTAMKRLAVREENTMVARVTLHNMRQDRDEPVRAYGARLRGQASVCKFTQQCTGCEATVDYTEAILKDVLCQGLGDTEIQLDLLGDKNQDMTMGFVEAKEAGKRSASRMLLPQATDVLSGSSYTRSKKGPHQRNKRHVRIVEPKGMEEALRRGSEGPNARHSTPRANIATRKITLESMQSQEQFQVDKINRTARCYLRHTMRPRGGRQHKGCHARPPCV